MEFKRYPEKEAFVAEVLPVLMENEVQNNLPISFFHKKDVDSTRWLMSCVQEDGRIMLVAVCTPPHNVILYETGNRPCQKAVLVLATSLRELDFPVPGVLAEQGLAHRFAQAYLNSENWKLHVSMHIMQLDKVSNLVKAPGFMRSIEEEDQFFLPHWRRAFEEDCHLPAQDLRTHTQLLVPLYKERLHFLWEDNFPVAMAAQCRKTENGAVIGNVYTPPQFRGKGYGQALVASLSQLLLNRGNRFCCLFADAENPISCGIYRKIGYRELCIYDELHFSVQPG